jgi:hypothetical protein
MSNLVPLKERLEERLIPEIRQVLKEYPPKSRRPFGASLTLTFGMLLLLFGMYLIVRIFRESVILKPAQVSFRQGWREAMSGQTYPVSELWEGVGKKLWLSAHLPGQAPYADYISHHLLKAGSS